MDADSFHMSIYVVAFAPGDHMIGDNLCVCNYWGKDTEQDFEHAYHT